MGKGRRSRTKRSSGPMRVVTIVLDSGGVGALPDFAAYADAPGANTLGNVAARVGGLRLPNLERYGLGSPDGDRGRRTGRRLRQARVARLRSRSRGEGHDHRPLGDGGDRDRGPVPDLSATAFRRRSSRRSRGSPGRRRSGNVAGFGDRNHRGAWDRSTWRRAGRSSTLRQIRSFRSRRTRRSSLLRPCTTGASGLAAMLVPPHNVNRVIARPFRGRTGGFLSDAESTRLRDRAAAERARSTGRGGYRGARRRENLRHLLRSRNRFVGSSQRQS